MITNASYLFHSTVIQAKVLYYTDYYINKKHYTGDAPLEFPVNNPKTSIYLVLQTLKSNGL